MGLTLLSLANGLALEEDGKLASLSSKDWDGTKTTQSMQTKLETQLGTTLKIDLVRHECPDGTVFVGPSSETWVEIDAEHPKI